MRSLSQLIEEDIKTLPVGEITLMQLLWLFHERGFGFVLFVLALPMALPIPVPPGVNIALALPLLFLTTQQMLGFSRIWLPSFLGRKTLRAERFREIMSGTLPFLRKVEWIFKPRLSAITHGLFSRLIGLSGLIMALSVCIPIPLSNTVPSLGIALMAVGVLMRDRLAIVAGMLIGLGWVFLLIWAAITFGPDGVDIIKETIKGWIS